MRSSYSSGVVEGYQHYAYLPPKRQPQAPLPPQQQPQQQPQPQQYPSPMTQLFEVNATTECGDVVVLVGGTQALGNWDVQKGICLDTDKDAYPIWHARIRGCLPACEYKFAIKRCNGEVVWEQTDNRTLRPLTNRVAAIFNEPREIARTCASDAALFARRQEGLVLTAHLPTATMSAARAASYAQPPAHYEYDARLLPPKPTPQPLRLLSTPPPMALGSPFTPFVAHVGGTTAESSPCVSRVDSLADSRQSLSRVSSSASCSRLHRSVSAQSQGSLKAGGGSRVSFSKDLFSLPNCGHGVPL